MEEDHRVAEEVGRLLADIPVLEQKRRASLNKDEIMTLSETIITKKESLKSLLARLGDHMHIRTTSTIDVVTIPGIKAEVHRLIMVAIPEIDEKRLLSKDIDAEERKSLDREVNIVLKILLLLMVKQGRLEAALKLSATAKSPTSTGRSQLKKCATGAGRSKTAAAVKSSKPAKSPPSSAVQLFSAWLSALMGGPFSQTLPTKSSSSSGDGIDEGGIVLQELPSRHSPL